MLRLSYTLLFAALTIPAASLQMPDTGSGELTILGHDGFPAGECPLKHTSVSASISGPVGRVTVTQEFTNNEKRRIEAVYVFPLPSNSAVDSMTMKVGERHIRGIIKPREEAKRIYDEARRQGSLASLLSQERPNIFTQSVANIGPGETVHIEIAYVELMPFDSGRYEFRFPMVVGPRYIPGRPGSGPQPIIQPTSNRRGRDRAVSEQSGGGWASDTDQVPDASHITPLVAAKGTRAGHDISIAVALDAGVPITSLSSTTHEVTIDRPSDHQANVRLRDLATLPNKDFVLTYDVPGKSIGDAVLTHTDSRGKFVTLLLTPPDRPAASEVAPKELVFVLDTSGSMYGFPIEKAKEAMRESLALLNPHDTFNLITFSGDTRILFPAPVAASKSNLEKALTLLNGQYGSGGTEMMRAIRAALAPSDSQDHVRIVCFMTDGYVGNDMEILAEVRKHPNARVFAFGIGSSVNHYLLDRMAAYGRGEVQYVGSQDDGSAAARRFTERVRNPVLTDVRLNWGDIGPQDMQPSQLPDLFSAKPVAITAKYMRPGKHVIRLEGMQGAHRFSREIAVNLPDNQPAHDELATLWARQKVESVMSGDLSGIQNGRPDPEIRAAITKLGMDYNLVTQFTSFVAVEERTITDHGQPKRIDVPVEMPEGVSHEGVFGADKSSIRLMARASAGVSYSAMAPMMAKADVGAMRSPAAAPRAQPQMAADLSRTSKLDDTLDRILTKTQNGIALTLRESAYLHDGKVNVMVMLASGASAGKVTAAGLKLTSPQQGLMLKGSISLADLPKLTAIGEVLFVSLL